MIDWNAAKTEYITTDTSYQKLAQKYGVSKNTLATRAQKEKWTALRQKHKDEITKRAVQNVEKKASECKTKLYELAMGVSKGLRELTEQYTLAELIALGIKPKDITGAIKDLEDALHIKSERDIEEQAARIAKLRKEAESEDKAPASIAINILGGEDSWSK